MVNPFHLRPNNLVTSPILSSGFSSLILSRSWRQNTKNTFPGPFGAFGSFFFFGGLITVVLVTLLFFSVCLWCLVRLWWWWWWWFCVDLYFFFLLIYTCNMIQPKNILYPTSTHYATINQNLYQNHYHYRQLYLFFPTKYWCKCQFFLCFTSSPLHCTFFLIEVF